MEIEQMFDALKNMLHAGVTYMQNEDALQGWMFINHIALQWCHQTYRSPQRNEFIGQIRY